MLLVNVLRKNLTIPRTEAETKTDAHLNRKSAAFIQKSIRYKIGKVVLGKDGQKGKFILPPVHKGQPVGVYFISVYKDIFRPLWQLLRSIMLGHTGACPFFLQTGISF